MVITNRGDCCGERLSNFEIRYGTGVSCGSVPSVASKSPSATYPALEDGLAVLSLAHPHPPAAAEGHQHHAAVQSWGPVHVFARRDPDNHVQQPCSGTVARPRVSVWGRACSMFVREFSMPVCLAIDTQQDDIMVAGIFIG